MTSRRSSLILIPIIYLCFLLILTLAEAKKKVHISDDLDDVTDDEEDDDWKRWGQKSTPPPEFDPPPSDFSGMDPSKIQEEMMKRHTGPSFGFVKLRFGVRRTPDMVAEICLRWTKYLRTGSILSKFNVVDLSTIMFTLDKGQDTLELREFILSQGEAYEVKIGDQLFRRPGDPPLEEVIEKLRGEKNNADSTRRSEEEGDSHGRDEL